ncbi:unnamed protein product [Parnassius mnemosyne]|uniref:Uncharacterized protein n=1 Tax=Parnassius mnemosyne TaxID=213953 RepID=A0AAV1L417_9NEOP
MAFTEQIIFVSLFLATIGGGKANVSAPSPAAIACCMRSPQTPISPCYVTTTAAPLTCPFMTTTTLSPPTMTATTSTTTTEQPTTSRITQMPYFTSISPRQPDAIASSATSTTETPSTAAVPLRPNFVVAPNYPNHMPVITPPMNSSSSVVPPYPMLRDPQQFVPVMMNPSTGQAYYVVANPNKNGNSYSQILNVYTQDRNTGGYNWMPVAMLPQLNNNSTIVKPSSDNN